MPFLKPKYVRDGDGFYDSGVSAEMLQPNLPHALTIKGSDLLIVKLDDGEIVVVTATCPHAAAELKPEDCHRGRLICRDHDWKFDIKTGRTLYPEDENLRLKRYPIKLETTIKIQLSL